MFLLEREVLVLDFGFVLLRIYSGQLIVFMYLRYDTVIRFQILQIQESHGDFGQYFPCVYGIDQGYAERRQGDIHQESHDCASRIRLITIQTDYDLWRQ